MSGAVNHYDLAPVVLVGRMLEQCDQLSIRRYSGVANPVLAVDQYLSDGIFQAPVVARKVDHSKIAPVRRPVGIEDMLKQFARRTTAHRRSGQCACPLIVSVKLWLN